MCLAQGPQRSDAGEVSSHGGFLNDCITFNTGFGSIDLASRAPMVETILREFTLTSHHSHLTPISNIYCKSAGDTSEN